MRTVSSAKSVFKELKALASFRLAERDDGLVGLEDWAFKEED